MTTLGSFMDDKVASDEIKPELSDEQLELVSGQGPMQSGYERPYVSTPASPAS